MLLKAAISSSYINTECHALSQKEIYIVFHDMQILHQLTELPFIFHAFFNANK
jgi:hypothetical protein